MDGCPIERWGIFNMSRNSADYQVFIPDKFGPLARMSHLEDSDMTDVSDSIPGTLNSIIYTAPNGKPFEILRYRTPNPSSVGIRISEAASQFLFDLRDNDCVLAIQRKRCADGFKQHYGRFQLNNASRSNTTAQGINAQDNVPLVTMPGTYSRYFEFTDKGPLVRFDEDENLVPIEMVYCDCPDCCGTSGCKRLFVLYKERLGTSFTLKTSPDEGINWQVITTGLEGLVGLPTAMHCYYGRLFIAFDFAVTDEDKAIYYSDDPVSGVFTAVNEFFPPFIGSSSIVSFAHYGQVIYALFRRVPGVGDNTSGVARSQNNGFDWEIVFENTIANDYYDIAAGGRHVGFVGDTGSFICSQNWGDLGTWQQFAVIGTGLSKHPSVPDQQQINEPFIGIGMWQYDWRDLSCVVVLLVDTRYRVFASADYELWPLQWEDCTILETVNPPVKVEVGADGWLIWIHGIAEIDDELVTIVLKNNGENCWHDTRRVFNDVITAEPITAVDVLLPIWRLTIPNAVLCNFQIGEEREFIFGDGNIYIGVIDDVVTPVEITVIFAVFPGGFEPIEVICEFIRQTSVFAACPLDPDKSVLIPGPEQE